MTDLSVSHIESSNFREANAKNTLGGSASSDLSDVHSSEAETDKMELFSLDQHQKNERDPVTEPEPNRRSFSLDEKGVVSEPEPKRRKMSSPPNGSYKNEMNGHDSHESSKQEEEEQYNIQEEDEVAIQKDLERQRIREEAIGELSEIEIEFAKLKDSIYESQLSKLQFELQLCESGVHPEYSRITEILTRGYEKRLKYLINNQKYQLQSIDNMIRGTRYHIHQNFEKNRQDCKASLIQETTSKWYAINRERRNLDNLALWIPDYCQFNPHLKTKLQFNERQAISDLVDQRNSYLTEIGLLSTLQKNDGFPSSLQNLQAAREDEIEEDLSAMGIKI